MAIFEFKYTELNDVSIHDDKDVDLSTAVVYTLNDLAKLSSSRVTLAGNPNDYVGRLANLSVYSTNLPIYSRILTSSVYDNFYAVTIDAQSQKVYYSNKAIGRIAYSRIYHNDNPRYYSALPVAMQVNFTFA